MNARTIRLFQEMLIAMVMSIALELTIHYTALPYMAFTLLPLIWLALRYGSATAVVAASLSGLVSGLIMFGITDILKVILLAILPMLSVGVSGFFAKYTQKTLNNRRLSSTYLNISTATLLALLLCYSIRFAISPLALNMPIILMDKGIGFIITLVIISLVMCLLAKMKPACIIPKRSKYLSRKETSILLND